MMIEQEAEVLAARLMRIWEPHSQQWTFEDEEFHFHGDLTPDVFVSLDKRHTGFLSAKLATRGKKEVYLGLRADGQLLAGPPHAKEVAEQLSAHWLPFFRRGCWLSGCDIEASAHERIEWVQGFSREELEAWNLKI